MCNTAILPLFDYCDVVWDSCDVISSIKLQRLQNRSARVITRTDNATPSEDVVQQLNWGKLEDRRRLHKVILMYKCLHKETESVNVNLIRHMDRHQHYKRPKEDFILPKPKTEQLKRTFRYSAAQIWNSLPVDIRESETLNAFKRAYVNTI